MTDLSRRIAELMEPTPKWEYGCYGESPADWWFRPKDGPIFARSHREPDRVVAMMKWLLARGIEVTFMEHEPCYDQRFTVDMEGCSKDCFKEWQRSEGKSLEDALAEAVLRVKEAE